MCWGLAVLWTMPKMAWATPTKSVTYTSWRAAASSCDAVDQMTEMDNMPIRTTALSSAEKCERPRITTCATAQAANGHAVTAMRISICGRLHSQDNAARMSNVTARY